jgi:mannose-1-phosphate guanylyltransferase
MLNGDVLTDVDITAQIAQHEQTGAGATLGLVPVDDPSAYGLVLLNEDKSVKGFLEKPRPGQLTGIDEYLISAGIYVLERPITDLIEPDIKVSIEHVIWPQLVEQGSLYGFAARGNYWMDIGTPDRYLQGTFDILDKTVHTDVQMTAASSHVTPPALVGEGAVIEDGAHVGPYAVIGPGAKIGAGARVNHAVVLDEARIGPRCLIENAVVAERAVLDEDVLVSDEAIVGEGATVGAGHRILDGAKIEPGAAA